MEEKIKCKVCERKIIGMPRALYTDLCFDCEQLNQSMKSAGLI